MTGFTDRHPRLPVLCALLIVLTLGACGGEDEPPPPTATATPTTTQAATVSPPAPTATATAPPATANPAAVAELPVDIDSEARWREVYDALSVGERTCIRDALGAELFESALSRPVVNEGEANSGRWTPTRASTRPWRAPFSSPSSSRLCLRMPALC